jgi:hypothetical protein
VNELVRRAGRGTDATGALVVWSIAEGRRGRRWREVRSLAGGGVVSSLLLETDPDGRFSHAELGTEAGLLTLHPEGDGTIHGNVVTAAGVEHLKGLPWSRDSVLMVEGSTVAATAAARGLRNVVAAGRSVTRTAVIVDLGLAVRTGDVSIAAIHGEGVPLLADAQTWPLEGE